MVVVYVQVKVKPEFLQAFKKKLQSNIDQSLQQTGCQRFEVYVDMVDPHTFVLYEEWATQDDFNAYQEADYFKAFGKWVFPKLDGAPNSSYYEATLIN